MNRLLATVCLVLILAIAPSAQAQMVGSDNVYYEARPGDLWASKLIGAEVYNAKNENIGKVTDLVLDGNHKVQAVVLDVGNFLGIGKHYIAVKPEQLGTVSSGGRFNLNADRVSLTSAPEFDITPTTGSINARDEKNDIPNTNKLKQNAAPSPGTTPPATPDQ